jgi:energy-coupling factor transport system ATP-binding protein
MNVDLSDITYSYPLPGGITRPALRGVDLTIQSGSCLGVIGPEGAGKTTLLLLLDMLLRPDRGTMSIDGEPVESRSRKALDFRRRIGMQFQFPEQQFVADSVRAEMTFGLAVGRHPTIHEPGAVLSSVGLEARGLLDRSPFLLSMGEGRRVALAALLMRDPEMLLLDEPTAGLDGLGREEFIHVLSSLNARKKTMVIVSHDLDFIAEVASHLAVLREGVLLRSGEIGSVFTDLHLLEQAGYERPEVSALLDTRADQNRITRESLTGSARSNPSWKNNLSEMKDEGK